MISNNMLTCSATLYKSNGFDEDRNPEYSEGVELSKIYYSSTLGVNNGNVGATPGDVVVMYYDCFNSMPKGLTFNKGDKVIIDGNDYSINRITPCYSNGLQHYEIGLV